MAFKVSEFYFPLISQRNNILITTDANQLYSAAKSGRLDVVQMLLSRDVSPNTSIDDGFTALMTAAEAGHAEVVKVLANHPDCELSARNSYGQTALGFAAQNNRVEAALAIIQARNGIADIEAKCGGGRTAAEVARTAGHNHLADVLAEAARKAQVNN